MRIYKHYSFDLWMTLIRSNPSFKGERARYFHDRFNGRRKSLENIALVFRQVDQLCNAINEKTGGNMEAEEMYLMVIGAMNDYDDSVKEVDVSGLYEDMESLFLAYPPVVYEDRTIPVLEALRLSTAGTFSLLSNTAFIKGRTIRKALPGLKLEGMFDFELYSDETGVSKPNRQFFQLMLDAVTLGRGAIDLTDIIHIGDNPEADVKGAGAIGIDALLINSNNLDISRLMEY